LKGARKETREMTSLLGAVLRRGKMLAERSTNVEAHVVVIMFKVLKLLWKESKVIHE
jgi:hypothetical protein